VRRGARNKNFSQSFMPETAKPRSLDDLSGRALRRAEERAARRKAKK